MSTKDDADFVQDIDDVALDTADASVVETGAAESIEDSPVQNAQPRRQAVEFDYKTGSFVRARAPRKTAGKIDDLAQDDSVITNYTHDSKITVGGGAFSGGRKYHASRKKHENVRKSQYGQYLEIPKGKRSIFLSREHDRRVRMAVASVILIVAVIIALLFLIKFLSGQ